MTEARRIVVGIDRNDSIWETLEWAAEEARLRGCRLRIVHVYDPAAGFLGEPEEESRVRGKLEASYVDHVVSTIAHRYAKVAIEAEAVPGDPVDVLLGEGAGAELVVTGSRRLSAFGAFFSGSVGQRVTAQSTTPSVVVRGPRPSPEAIQRIVVGFGGVNTREETLRFAFEEADRRGADLEVVRAWLPPLWQSEMLIADIEQRTEQSARDELAEALHPWRHKFPDVRVRRHFLRQHPVDALAERSRGCALLVVGNRPHRVLAGEFLGSVSQAVLHHVHCPIAVVPTVEPAGAA